jgi:hypothetical protein
VDFPSRARARGIERVPDDLADAELVALEPRFGRALEEQRPSAGCVHLAEHEPAPRTARLLGVDHAQRLVEPLDLELDPHAALDVRTGDVAQERGRQLARARAGAVEAQVLDPGPGGALELERAHEPALERRHGRPGARVLGEHGEEEQEDRAQHGPPIERKRFCLDRPSARAELPRAGG